MDNLERRTLRNPRFIIKPRIVKSNEQELKGSDTPQVNEPFEQPHCQGGVCFLRWKPTRKSA